MVFYMEDIIFEEFDVLEINKEADRYTLTNVSKKVISEISLRIIVDDFELASLLCLNQCQEKLAIGFLFTEGVINSFDDIQTIYYNERMLAVIIKLQEGIIIDKRETLRSVTTGCGKCVTYINSLKQGKFVDLEVGATFSVETILQKMKSFVRSSEIFKTVGGVHSVLFSTPEYELLNEDIGRHNCFDKISGILLKERKLDLTSKGLIFVSGRISSEIVTKVIRLGVPVIVSRSTPTTSAVRLAKQFHVTLLGYVRDDKGYIYSCPERITV